jgi:hypothetical protein
MPINPKEIASPAGRVVPPVYTTGKAFFTNFPFDQRTHQGLTSRSKKSLAKSQNNERFGL